MTKLIGISMAILIVAVMLIGVKAISDLNDGRVRRVVNQMGTLHINSANANNQ